MKKLTLSKLLSCVCDNTNLEITCVEPEGMSQIKKYSACDNISQYLDSRGNYLVLGISSSISTMNTDDNRPYLGIVASHPSIYWGNKFEGD